MDSAQKTKLVLPDDYLADETCAEERTCVMRLVVRRDPSHYRTCYDARGGLQRSMTLRGCVDHSFYSDIALGGRRPKEFLHKRILIKFLSPPNPEWAETIRQRLGVQRACGVVSINAGVQPERIGEVEAEPVTLKLLVAGEAFDAIRRDVAQSQSDGCTLFLDVVLTGNSLPEPHGRSILPSLSGSVSLEELDVSRAQEHAVREFEIYFTPGRE